jgi:competence protein ComEA
MKISRFLNGWVLAALLLVIVIIAGSIIIGQKAGHSQALEISTAPQKETVGTIYIGGEVNNPGYYPVFSGDSLDDVIAAAGGLKQGADLNNIELIICNTGNAATPQKININRAETWLLKALPGVGDVKAQAIVDYRNQHGIFRDINELKQVPGFGDAGFDMIKDMITVND